MEHQKTHTPKGNKVCPNCKVNKKPSEYNIRKYFSFKTNKTVLLLDSYCRPCSAIKAARWRKRNPVRYKAVVKKQNLKRAVRIKFAKVEAAKDLLKKYARKSKR